MSAGEFARAESELDELLGVAAQSSGSEVRRRSDSYGFQWLVIRDPDFEDLVTTVHLVSSELDARGFGEQLLAALFPFEGKDRRVNVVYGFSGTCWPFIPTGSNKERDNARRCAKERARKELVEPDLDAG